MKENKRRRHISSCCQGGLRTSVDNNKKQNLFSGGGEEEGGGGAFEKPNLCQIFARRKFSRYTAPVRERHFFFFFHGIENMSIVGCGLGCFGISVAHSLDHHSTTAAAAVPGSFLSSFSFGLSAPAWHNQKKIYIYAI